MANTAFKHGVNALLNVEGRFVDDPDDPGGATNWGISLRWYKKAIDDTATVDTIRHLSRGQAVSLYHSKWWANPDNSTISYDLLPGAVGIAVFLFSVNAGTKRSHEFLQKALKRVGFKVKVDGVLGPRTANAVRASDLQSELISRMSVEAIMFYQRLDRPKFIEGWMFRAVETGCVARELGCLLKS